MSLDDFYKFYGLSNTPKKIKDNQEINNLFKIPKKEKRLDMPKFYNFVEDNTHMMDILYLPDDNGFKYCLVVMDIATNKMDAEPLKRIGSSDIVQGLKDIYKRKILNKPSKVITDSGSEFKGMFKEYLNVNKINLKTALPGRHRQVGPIEKKNQILGKILMMRMFAVELLTGEENKEWVDDLKDIIDQMNNKYYHEPLTSEELIKKFSPWNKVKQKLIPIGTKVRVKLDQPKNITDKKLHGNFRSGDHRWSIEHYKIINIIFDPIEPVMYEIDKPLKPNQKVAYTKQQLQIVKDEEQSPPGEQILKNKSSSYYIVKTIHNMKKINGKIKLLVEWKGYPKKDTWTWEEKNNIPKVILDDYLNKIT